MSTTSNKRRLASGISAFAIATSLGFATPALAQETTGSLQGHVDAAKPGDAVIAVDTHTGQRFTGTVDARGNYAILGLRPSEYTITAGGQTQSATLLVGQTVSVDFVAAAGAGGKGIVVTGRRIAHPSQTQTVTTNITPAQIENLPQNQRNFLSFATLAPGIQLTNPSGASQFQAGALAAQNANILLDGMSFKNPINHGGFFGQNFGSLGNPFPEIAIDQYQVESQNFGAETGQSATAVLSAITKTGGDHFHGSFFGEWQPKSFIERPFFTTGPKQDYDRKQFGGELGGPIIPGKLTFYVAGEGVIQKLPAATFNVNAPGGVPQNIASEINGAIPQNFKQGLYFGKLTYFATPNDTVNLMGYVRRQHNLEDFGGNSTFEHARNVITHQTREQLQWRHSNGGFVNELNISHDLSTQATPAVSSGPEYILTNGQNTSSQLVLLGGNAFTQGDTEKSWVIKDDATLHHGDHTFRAGTQVTFYNLSRTQNQHFNATYFVANPCDPSAGLGATCPITNFDISTATPYAGEINVAPSPTSSGKDTQVGLYIEDEWKPDQHWTIDYGLRWDFESNANNNNYVTPTAIADALRQDQGWITRGINANDYISNGHNRHPFWGEFQPRLGVSYDVNGDHDFVVFGGAGRYYDRPLFLEGQIEKFQNSNVDLTVTLPGCPGAAYCTDPNALRTYIASQNFIGGNVYVLPNKVKMPYSDQFDLGIRKQIGPIQASLTYSHVESHNIFYYGRANFYDNGWYSVLLTPTGCVNGGDTWIDDVPPNGPFPNCPVSGAQLPGFNGKLNRGLNNGRARLDAVYLHLEKPFTNNATWGFTESLTIQRARTNTDQELSNADELYNAPEFGAYGWDYAQGIAKWSSVTTAIWRAPWGITASGTLSLNSGPAFGNVIFYPPDQTPVGACCYGNMGGVFYPHKTFGYRRLDVRLAKTFKMPWGHELTADFQVFNVFNWLNRNYSSWGAGGGTNPTFTEDSAISNDQRQFQAGLSYKF